MTRQPVQGDADFMARRDRARQRIDDLTGAKGGDADDRMAWFNAVYREAGGDAAAVPWADLAPKQVLVDWLEANPGQGQSALDIGCGLGDNAEALAGAGYRATAFDLSPEAIDWARRRFPGSKVRYLAADLFHLPAGFHGGFDLVHECYTVQALDEPLRGAVVDVIAGLVAPGGRLLFINRCRDEASAASGPPWPVMPSEWRRFEDLGLHLVHEQLYTLERPDRAIPHVCAEFRRPV